MYSASTRSWVHTSSSANYENALEALNPSEAADHTQRHHATLSIDPALTTSTQSSPRPTSPVNTPSGSSTARPSSPKPPGGPATAIRRKAAADYKDKTANQRPASTRAAGAGGSSSTMLKLYTDDSPGLKVDPVVVLVLSVGFIISVVALHSMFWRD